MGGEGQFLAFSLCCNSLKSILRRVLARLHLWDTERYPIGDFGRNGIFHQLADVLVRRRSDRDRDCGALEPSALPTHFMFAIWKEVLDDWKRCRQFV